RPAADPQLERRTSRTRGKFRDPSRDREMYFSKIDQGFIESVEKNLNRFVANDSLYDSLRTEGGIQQTCFISILTQPDQCRFSATRLRHLKGALDCAGFSNTGFAQKNENRKIGDLVKSDRFRTVEPRILAFWIE